MKNHLFVKLSIVLAITLISFSCNKKDNKNTPTPTPSPQPSGQYYIKAKLNGELANYIVNPKGSIQDKHFTAYATNDAAINYPMFSMEIEDGQAITTKTYLESNATTNLIFRYIRKDDPGVFYSQLGEEMDFKISITEVKSDYIKGTFGGTIRYSGNPDESISVTDGEFMVSK